MHARGMGGGRREHAFIDLGVDGFAGGLLGVVGVRGLPMLNGGRAFPTLDRVGKFHVTRLGSPEVSPGGSPSLGESYVGSPGGSHRGIPWGNPSGRPLGIPRGSPKEPPGDPPGVILPQGFPQEIPQGTPKARKCKQNKTNHRAVAIRAILTPDLPDL